MRDTTIQIPEHIVFRMLEGEAVALNTKTGTYFGLDDTGSRMFVLLKEHRRLEPVVLELLSEFDVTEDRVRNDLDSFVAEMAKHGLIERVEITTS